MLVELTIRRTAGEPSPNSPVDGIRIIALLPSRWRKDLGNVVGDIAIRIQTDERVTGDQIREEVAAILTDPEAGDWELVRCRTLTDDHDPKEGTP